LCPIQNSKFIIQNTPFGKLSEFAKVFYTPNSKFKIHNSPLNINNYFVYLHKIIDKDKMVEFSFKVKGNSAPALAFIAYAKTLNFIEFDTPEKIVQAEPATTEDDEHYDFIMSLSKKTNKKVAARLAKEKNIILPSQKNKI